jgi:transposase
VLYRKRPKKIFYYGRAVDFRKQSLGLAVIVDTELPGELRAGHWFVFVSCDKKKAKILYWRGTGVALWQMRLERDLFKVGSPRSVTTRPLTWRDLGRFLDGLNVFAGEAHQAMSPKRFS